MSFLHLADKIRLRFGRYKVGAPTTNSQPGAHTGNSRQYIPGYSDSNIIFLDTVSGNDGNSGTTEGSPKLTYASAATAAGTTKKIRVINNGATLSTNITKPTEAKRGISATIASDVNTNFNTWSAATAAWVGSNTLVKAIWVQSLSKFFVVGGTSASRVGSSSNGTSFTEETSGFGTSVVYDITYSESLGLLCIVGADGKIATSPNGSTWTLRTSGVSSRILAVTWDDVNGVFVAGTNTNALLISFDGITWSTPNNISQDIPNNANATIFSLCSKNGVTVAGTNNGYIYYTQNGQSWAVAANNLVDSIAGIVYANNKFYAATLSLINPGFSSQDGISWATDGTAKGINSQIIYVEDTRQYYSANGSAGVFRTADLSTWTNASPAVTTVVAGLAWSPSLGILIGTGGGDIRYCNLVNVTVSADIAGFTAYGVSYGTGLNAYNCTFYEPYSTVRLNLFACRALGQSPRISSNTQAHFGTLFEGDAFFTSAPASQNAFALNCNTFGGSVYLNNSSATNYEQIRDNVIVGDFTASFAAPMLSGNLQGTNTNGILAKTVTLSDPAFVNTTDYKLKRLTNGDSQDSPLCNAAVYYVNEQGQPRDMGAWSEDDSENPVDYRYSYFIDKPAGNGIRPQKIVAASADQGMDGTWDSVNEPERASEYLTITYSTAVSREHVTIQDLLESLIDMTCEVSLTPDLSDPDTAVTVNGNHSIGDIVLNIDASSTIKAGMVLPIGGVNYFILYTASGSSPTKLVLHKPLESAVSDNTVITPQEPTTYGTYQYIPQSREIPRPTKMETDYVNGVSFKFVRQYPQV